MRAYYLLSKHFAPPMVDLRQGRLNDDHGETVNAQLQIKHRDPSDVSRRELEYYYNVWGFLEPQDLMFYLYPVMLAGTGQANTPLFLDEYLEVLERRLPVVAVYLNHRQATVLKSALSGITGTTDQKEFPNICAFVQGIY